MLIPIVVMATLAIVLTVISYTRGEHILGLKTAGNLLLQVVPLLIFSFVVAGMIQTLIPKEVISRWVGAESGWRGIFIGTVVGGLIPGGPYVSLPLAAGMLKIGAGVGTTVALLTGWSLLEFTQLPLQIGILGWKFALIRLACTFFFPPIAGLIANLLFSRVSVT